MTSTADTEQGSEGSASSLLDRILPAFDAALVSVQHVAAPADLTAAALSTTDLLDPVVRSLFALRELPERLRSVRDGEGWATAPRALTLRDLLRPESGMVLLAEIPGREIVAGSVGRFWEPDYGHRIVSPEEFATFCEPGYARLAVSLLVHPEADGGCTVRYEVRTATTDDAARRAFRRYWAVIRAGVRLVMWRAVARIKAEAERRYAAWVAAGAA